MFHWLLSAVLWYEQKYHKSVLKSLSLLQDVYAASDNVVLLQECGICGFLFTSSRVWTQSRSPISSELEAEQRMIGRVISGQIFFSTFLWRGLGQLASCEVWDVCQTNAGFGVLRDFTLELLYWIPLHMCKYCIGSTGDEPVWCTFDGMCSV